VDAADAEYRRLVTAADALTIEDAAIDALATAARARGDAVTETMALLLAETEAEGPLEWRARSLARRLPAESRRQLVARIAGWRDAHSVWHLLVDLATTFPDDVTTIEAALAGWSDGVRQMPHAWWADVAAGRWAPGHLLVRELVVRGGEANVLLRPEAARSLGGVTSLGLERPALETAAGFVGLPAWPALTRLVLRDADWDAPGVLASAPGLPGVRILEIQGGRPTARGVANLVAAASFPALATLRVVLSPARPVPLAEVVRELDARMVARRPFALELSGFATDDGAAAALAAAPVRAGLAALSLPRV
jgi:hypothetical protein